MFENLEAQDLLLQSKTQAHTQVRHPIVIVDDSSDDRAMLSMCLRSFLPRGKPVISLTSGEALLDYLADLEGADIEADDFQVEIPDMIFLDLMMPGLDGIKTLQAIRSKTLWADVPVTLVTCSHDDQAIENAENAGANAFLPKPFKTLDVIQALNRGTNFSPAII